MVFWLFIIFYYNTVLFSESRLGSDLYKHKKAYPEYMYAVDKLSKSSIAYMSITFDPIMGVTISVSIMNLERYYAGYTLVSG
jgi:hypothetical protein